MVHLIHRKRVPLLHNSVLILCDEGDGLVAVLIWIQTVYVNVWCNKYSPKAQCWQQETNL